MKVVRSALPILLVLFSLLSGSSYAEEQAQDISPSDLHEKLNSGRPPLVIDVRTVAEFKEGHVPGAINIPHTDIAKRIDEVRESEGRGVVLYCMMGPRARLAEKALLENGFRSVLHLDGGLAAWLKSGFPTEK